MIIAASLPHEPGLGQLVRSYDMLAQDGRRGYRRFTATMLYSTLPIG
jgi:hypothetical protein